MSRRFCFVWLCSVAGLAPTVARGAPFVTNVRYQRPFDGSRSGAPAFAALIENAPALDGRLDDKCWQAARPVTGFVEYQTDARQVTYGRTTLRFAHTREAIYIAATCEAAEPGQIKRAAPPGNRDRDAYGDDCLDLFFYYGGVLYQFVLGAGGARMDLRSGDPTWNPEWRAAVTVAENAWQAEIAINFAAIRHPAPYLGGAICFNVGRATAPKRLISSLFPGYNDVEKLGLLVFGTPEARAAHLVAYPAAKIQETRFFLDKWTYDDMDEAAYGRLRLIGVRPDRRAATDFDLTSHMTLRPENGTTPVRTAEVGPIKGEVMDFQVNTASLPAGEYVLKTAVKDGQGQLIDENEHPLIRVTSEPPPAQGVIPVQVDIPQAAGKYASGAAPVPVYAGVPIPRGWITPHTSLQLCDEQGAPVSAQVDTLATWSRNGSKKWLGLHFQLTSPRARNYTLRFNSQQQLKTPPPQPCIETGETETSFVINTGPLRFEVRKSAFDGFHQAWLDLNGDGQTTADERLFPDDPNRAPYVVDQDGTVYRASRDAKPEVDLEVDGPLCTVLRAAGWYADDEGARVCRHVTRIVAYAGLSWVRIRHTFIFAADSREVKLADIGMPFALRDCSPRYRFGVSPRDMYLSAAGTTRAYLLQHEKDAFDLRTAWPDSELTFAQGTHAHGWIETTNARAAVAVGLREFWQNYPKELEAANGQIIVHVWPKHGDNKPRKPLTESNLSALWFVHHRKLLDFQAPEWFSSFTGDREKKGAYRYVRNSANANGMGVARSCEMFVNFRPLNNDTTPAVAACVNEPPVAAAAPDWMCRSGAFGRLSARDETAFPVIEKAMDARFDGERALERFSWGMWNYGGSVTYFRTLIGSYDQIERPWRLTHHGGPRAPWLLFARSGKRKFFEYARRNSLRCADLGFCHYSTPATERGQGAWGRKVRGAQCDYKGIVPWSSGARVMDYNSMADFLHYLTYFTGDRWPSEVALEWGECTKKRFRPKQARSASGTLDTLLSMYEATWDLDYREMAERQFLHLVDNILTKDGYFRTGNWYDYAPWLSHYCRLTGSRKAQDAAARWAGRIIRTHWLGNQIFGDDTCFDRAMGYPLYDVFRLAYESTRDRRFLEMALGCAKVVGISVMLDRASRLYGVDMFSGSSTGGYFDQTVPYVLPLLTERKDKIRALFPRWRLHVPRVRLLIRDSGEAPLELRIHFTDKPAATFTVTPAQGEPGTPQPVEIVEEICFQGGQRDNAKTAEKLVFARVILPPRPQGGVTEVVFNSRDGQPFGMFAPVQLSRPAKLVFAWDTGMSFARGSAIYFRTPTTNETVRIRVPYARWSTPHSLALLDTSDTIRAMEQWFPPERPGNIMLTAQLQPAERGQVWCCLQGLSKAMVIEPGDEHIPPFFSDRPERFFLPQERP